MGDKTKDELLTEARERGVDADDEMKKAEIKEALDSAEEEKIDSAAREGEPGTPENPMDPDEETATEGRFKTEGQRMIEEGETTETEDGRVQYPRAPRHF